MAWDALFKVPLLGALSALFGAFPVDVRKGQGREAYERAQGARASRARWWASSRRASARARAGWSRALREGAARLAWETGAPLVPATIAGAYRAWPHFQSLPAAGAHPRALPRAHRPRALAAACRRSEALPAAARRAAAARGPLAAAGGEGRPAHERALPPARRPGRARYESAPALALAAARLLEDAVAAGGGAGLGLPRLPAAGPLRDPAVAADEVDPQRLAGPLPARPTAATSLRHLRPARACPRARPWPRVMAGALFPYLYEHGRSGHGLRARAVVAAACLELGALSSRPRARGRTWPCPSSPPPSPGSAQTVFWRYAAPVLRGVRGRGARCSSGRTVALACPTAVAGLLALAARRGSGRDRVAPRAPRQEPVDRIGLDVAPVTPMSDASPHARDPATVRSRRASAAAVVRRPTPAPRRWLMLRRPPRRTAPAPPPTRGGRSCA